MTRSIRWSFALWQAAILALAVIALSVFLFRELRVAAFEEVDAELHGAVLSLVSNLRPPPDERRPGPPRERGPPRGGPLSRLPAALEAYFDPELANAAYFVIWSPRGRVVESSTELDALAIAAPEIDGETRDEVLFRVAEGRREAFLIDRNGGVTLAGRSIAAEEMRLRRLQWMVVVGGSIAVLLGSLVGWLVARRVVRPIDGMSRIAEAISASDLSGRIDAGSGPSELEGLARSLNRAFDRLQDAFERQKRFVADASHELRTPLAVLLVQTQHALAKERTSERYQAALTSCERAAERMRRLVDQLLTLSAVDSSRVELKRERVDLRELTEEIAVSFEPLASERSTSIVRELEHCEVVGDADRLCEIVSNLIANALRYGPAGGRVFVRLRADGSRSILEVEDEGDGVPPELRERIFDRFFRVDASRSRAEGGSGLGLAITRELVEAHGGRIVCDEGSRGGALFRVSFPTAAP